MRFSIFAAIFAAAAGVVAEESKCEHCCGLCIAQVGKVSDLDLGSCWGNCQAYACGGKCPNETYKL